MFDFSERMLFFTSGAVEENIQGQTAPVPARKASSAAKPTGAPQYLGRVHQ